MPLPGDPGVPNGLSFGASGRDNLSVNEIRELLNDARTSAIAVATRPPRSADDQLRRSLAAIAAAAASAEGRVFVPGLKVGEAPAPEYQSGDLGSRLNSESTLNRYAREMEEQNRRIDEELASQREALQSGRPLRVPRPVQTPPVGNVAKVSPLSVSPPPAPNFGPVKRRLILPPD
jgi:hypothetical protein